MARRSAMFIGVALLALVTVFGGTAFAAPLTVAPSKANMGTVSQNILGSETVTITNNTTAALGIGSYQLTGDVGLLGLSDLTQGQGFYVNVANSTCAVSGNADPDVGLTTRLAPGESCTFFLSFDGFFLPAGSYKAKLNFTFGTRKDAVPLSVTEIRVP